MTTLREEQQELEVTIKAADDLTRDRLTELGQLMVKYFRLLDRALKENEVLKARIAELEASKSTGCDDCDSGTFCYVHNGGRRR